MAGEIRLDPAAFADHAQRLGGALEEFRSYTTQFPTDAASAMEGFNSDFIDKLLKLLKHLDDNLGAELLASIDGYREGVAALAGGFTATDESLSQGFSGGGG